MVICPKHQKKLKGSGSFHFYNEAGGWLAGQYVPKNPDKRWVSLGKPEKEGHWTQE